MVVTEKMNCKIMWLKELVCASLGFLIIGSLFYFMWPHLAKDIPDVNTAQAIFSILGGWGGVVLGYYFGRIPAEKSAAKSEDAANASKKVEEWAVSSEKETLAQYKKKLDEQEQILEKYIQTVETLKELIRQT